MEQLYIHRQKKKSAILSKSHTYIKVNSKCITDFSVKCKTIKLLPKKKIGKNLEDLDLDSF